MGWEGTHKLTQIYISLVLVLLRVWRAGTMALNQFMERLNNEFWGPF